MDCGPASLKCLLEGFPHPGELRTLAGSGVGTDVDGTIDRRHRGGRGQAGARSGAWSMLPLDQRSSSQDSDGAPRALRVAKTRTGRLIFVVVWGGAWRGGAFRSWTPAMGRRWLAPGDLLDNLYVHTMPIPAEAWRGWADSDEFRRGLRLRLDEIGARAAGEELVARCSADETWQSFALLDAAVRMVEMLATAGGIDGGASAGALVASLFEKSRAEPMPSILKKEEQTIPLSLWTASWAAEPSGGRHAAGSDEGVCPRQSSRCPLRRRAGAGGKTARRRWSRSRSPPSSRRRCASPRPGRRGSS